MSFFGSRRQVDPAPRPVADTPPRLDLPQPPADVSQPVGFETVLGANSVMEGSLSSAANVRLDGTFTGVLEIGGNVTGKKVQLLRTGRVWGDIHAQALTTEEGAFIDGKITMVGHEYSPAPAGEPEPEPELYLPEAADEVEAEPEPAGEPEPAAEPEVTGSVFGEPSDSAAEADSTELLPAAPEPEPEPPGDEPEHPAES